MIVRGTTPPIRFTFKEVKPSEMTEAYLTIRQRSKEIERGMDDATILEDAIEWVLTQEETLSLEENRPVKIQCRYKFSDGSAGASRIYEEPVYDVLKEGEI